MKLAKRMLKEANKSEAQRYYESMTGVIFNEANAGGTYTSLSVPNDFDSYVVKRLRNDGFRIFEYKEIGEDKHIVMPEDAKFYFIAWKVDDEFLTFFNEMCNNNGATWSEVK
jgi:hypothetical protein